MGRIVLVVVVLGLAVVGILAQVGVFKSDSGRFVTARTDQKLPSVGSLDRSDDYGAATIRAYMDGAAACTPSGRALMARLQRQSGRMVGQTFAGVCRGGKSTAGALSAKVDRSDLDSQGRALWRIQRANGLPRGFRVWVRKVGGDWAVDEQCLDDCAS